MKHCFSSVQTRKHANTPWLIFLFTTFFLSLMIGLMAIPQTLAATTTMEVYQQQGRKAFGHETSIDVFNDPSLGGKKLVHPFTKGSYTFAVFNNSGSDLLPYSLSITASNPNNIPLVFSLQKNGEYIFGGKALDDMRDISEIKLPEKKLGGKKTDMYTLQWQWVTESDEIDTALGNIGTQEYSLTIKAMGSIDETYVPPNTGDQSNILMWVIVLLASTALILILLFCKRKKDEDKNENKITNENNSTGTNRM